MRISAWSSDLCSSDLAAKRIIAGESRRTPSISPPRRSISAKRWRSLIVVKPPAEGISPPGSRMTCSANGSRGKGSTGGGLATRTGQSRRSEEHTSELQSLMRISYAVFCLQKKTHKNNDNKSLSQWRHTKETNKKRKQEK